VGKSLFRYAPKALPHEILNNCIAIHWPTFAPPRWPTFTPALTPGIALDVTLSNDPVELVAGEYDAGIQIGDFIQRDMVAVRASLDQRLVVVGAPDYFARYPRPKVPEDLKEHCCVGMRFKSGPYRWEFSKGKRSYTFNPQGLISFDDPELCIQAVQRGNGIGIGLEEYLRPLINEGKLIHVLKDWCQPFSGFFLYYPSRRNQPAALAALIATLRLHPTEDRTHKPVSEEVVDDRSPNELGFHPQFGS
jgi:DNA-binding transcriptional LysR family regulator